MKKIMKYAAMLCVAAASLVTGGCADPHTANIEGYESRIYFREGGVQQLSLAKVESTARFGLSVCKGGFYADKTGSAVIENMTQSQLDIYNALNGTDFVAVPESCFSIPTGRNISFSSSESYKVVQVEVNIDAIENAMSAEQGTYVIALQLYADRHMTEELNYVILQPSIDIAYVSFNETESYMAFNKNMPRWNNVAAQLRLSADNDWDFSCELGLADDIDAVLESVNATYGDADNGIIYKMLPEGTYRFPESIEFNKGVSNVDFNVEVYRYFKEFQEEGVNEVPYYILPLEIKSTSLRGIELGETSRLFVLRVSHEYRIIGLSPVELTESNVSSPFTMGSDGQGISGMLDDDSKTWWHSVYNSTPGDEVYGYYIDVKLPSLMSHFHFSYMTRGGNDNAVPETVAIGGSVDGNEWTLIADNLDAPARGRGVWGELNMVTNGQLYNYVRFGVTSSTGSAGGNLKGATGGKCTALSGFKLDASDSAPRIVVVYDEDDE